MGAAATAAFNEAVVRVADVGAGAEVAVPDPADEAGHCSELDWPLGKVLVAPAGVRDQPEGRGAILGNDAEGLDDAGGREARVDVLEDARVEVTPKLGPQCGAGGGVVGPCGVVSRAGDEDGVGCARVHHEAAEDCAGLAGDGAYEFLPLVASVKERAHLEVWWPHDAVGVGGDADVVGREAGGKGLAAGALDHAGAGGACNVRGAEARG